MFHTGFSKIATTLVTLTPEEYFEVAREKDPYVGALAGAIAGSGAGALKGKKGDRAVKALIGAGLGAGAGAGVAHVGSKLYKKYQARKVRQYT